MKKILKLILKCLCVLLPLLGFCLYAGTGMLGYADDEAPYYLWNKDFGKQAHAETYDVLILGDSAANAAYMPEKLSSGTVNLSLGGTTPVVNYYILSDWLKKNPAPKELFLSVQDFHLSRADCYWGRTVYTHRLTALQNLEILWKAEQYQERSVAQRGWLLDLIRYELYLPDVYSTAILNSIGSDRPEINQEAQDSIVLHKGRYIGVGDQTYQDSQEIVFDSFQVGELFDVYTRMLLDLCEENGIRVHIVKLPLPPNEVFTPEYKEELQEYYQSLTDSFENVEFVWYSEPYPATCFADQTHMNGFGAARFSSFLKSEFPECFGSD